ncbi:MAG: discoidin domain-containing protein [Sedimentisphaerales bacterium]|nr:discoidin domain-containing protein [Sedimentisphaerales bacterium]
MSDCGYGRGWRKPITAAILYVTLTVCAAADVFQKQVEADWLLQERKRYAGNPTQGLTTQSDAAGAVDGVIDGKWGFHTEYTDNPWWQVDLLESRLIDRVVLWNRCDPGMADRMNRFTLNLSEDGTHWQVGYQHDGSVFFGKTDDMPLVVKWDGKSARFVRVQVPGKRYLHLDEVQVFAQDAPEVNIALHKPCNQNSLSQWSFDSLHSSFQIPFAERVVRILHRCQDLIAERQEQGIDVVVETKECQELSERFRKIGHGKTGQEEYFRARWIQRRLVMADPLLDMESILFAKRAPGMLPHMSDQYYGWWSRPGGGLFIVEDFKGPNRRLCCLTEHWAQGSFLRPDLSYDGKRVLFAYCRYDPKVAGMEKVDKDRLPESAFYHVFEMNLVSGATRQLTRGRYDDFDARYLPDGRIVFLSTRKGQFVQVGRQSALVTTYNTMPDSYVRCGGDNIRPCAVFTLHTMDADGGDLRAISAFENFEWTPSVAHDGRILYARWDYIDRFNGHFMSLWSTNQDGTNPQLVYGNYTTRPQCVFEARPIPHSNKLIFTAAAHHSIEGGSLVLLDRSLGIEHEKPLTRITSEVPFPETEAMADMYYANPYPISENLYLVAWSDKKLPPHRGSTPVVGDENPIHAMGLYLLDRSGNMELIYRDPDISSMYPIPLCARPVPPTHPIETDRDSPQKGAMFVQDIYQGLPGVSRGTIRRLRIIGVPPKTQPHMNTPVLGISAEDPGKFILGTVPVESDGSAYFVVPAGVSLFFQALDESGLAVQTMRSLTYVQPNQTLACVGCHESRDKAPLPGTRALATVRPASRIQPGPEGTWPLRFDRLVQPVLDRKCVFCHNPDGETEAGQFDLTARNSYRNLLSYAKEDLKQLAFEKDRSIVGQCPASQSKLLAMIAGQNKHYNVELDQDSQHRLATWMDVYAHWTGSFSPDQEELLRELQTEWADLLAEQQDQYPNQVKKNIAMK